MKLAQIDTSVLYPTTIPSTGKDTKFKPFRVREEKALLLAQVSGDVSTMLNTLESIVRSCVLDCPEELTTFDVEYLFLMIRAKSVEEGSDLNAICGTCKTSNHIRIDLQSAVLTDFPESMTVTLADNLKVVMRYPSVSDVLSVKDSDTPGAIDASIISSIKSVYFNDVAFHVSEGDLADVREFLLNRTDEEMGKIEEFINNIPTVVLRASFKCKSCETENKIEFKTLSDFF